MVWVWVFSFLVWVKLVIFCIILVRVVLVYCKNWVCLMKLYIFSGEVKWVVFLVGKMWFGLVR